MLIRSAIEILVNLHVVLVQFNSIHQRLFPPRINTLEKTTTIETIKLKTWEKTTTIDTKKIIRGGITQEAKAYKRYALNTNKNKYT